MLRYAWRYNSQLIASDKKMKEIPGRKNTINAREREKDQVEA